METIAAPLAVIGGGNMGRAIIAGAIRAGVVEPARVAVAEPDPARRAHFANLGVAAFPSGAETYAWLTETERAEGQGQVLLAVKPQMLTVVAAELAPRLAGVRRVVISILAGRPSAKVRDLLGPDCRIVRAMPNLAASIGKGTTAICLGAGAEPGDDEAARAIFHAAGPLVVTIEESMFDAFTALAGSGPAYVLYLAEAMVKAAEAMGFEPELAQRIVKETVAGAGVLFEQTFEPAEVLRAAVTSKGGTTEAACRVLDAAHVQEAVVKAILAARDRGRELSAGQH